MKRWVTLFTILAIAHSSEAIAQGRQTNELLAPCDKSRPPCIAYTGTKIYHEVTVVGIEGKGSARAVAKIRSTQANAATYCRSEGHTGAALNSCVRKSLQAPPHPDFEADCTTGLMKDWNGRLFEFRGRRPRATSSGEPDPFATEFIIWDTDQAEELQSCGACGYDARIYFYELVCGKPR